MASCQQRIKQMLSAESLTPVIRAEFGGDRLTNKENYKKLHYNKETAWLAMSVTISSTAAQLYEKSHIKRLAVGEW